ncbi:MAG TPA: hypothetical protein VGF28_19790 [Thermoanaerobaculia bacterium]
MLRNTLILPLDEALAAQLLQSAVEDLDVVLMLILGESERVMQLVEWADQLANKTSTASGNNLRRVVWIRQPDTIAARLAGILGDQPLPTVAVLNFHDEVRERLVDDGQNITPITLERAFLRGFQV